MWQLPKTRPMLVCLVSRADRSAVGIAAEDRRCRTACRSPICLSIQILSSWVPARPASERLRSRHKPYESSLHPPSTAERGSRRCDVVPILLAIDSLAVFNVIPRYAVLSNVPSASPRCQVSILRLQVCSRRLAVNLRSHDYYRCERQNSDEGRSGQTVTSVYDEAPFQLCIIGREIVAHTFEMLRRCCCHLSGIAEYCTYIPPRLRFLSRRHRRDNLSDYLPSRASAALPGASTRATYHPLGL